MDELAKLEKLSLVSKVCTELENHLGMNDKALGKKLKFPIYFHEGSRIRPIELLGLGLGSRIFVVVSYQIHDLLVLV